jgi:RecB family exonuclease
MPALGADDADAEADAEADEAKAAELRIPFRRWERMLGELGVASAGVEASLADYVRKRIAVTRAELAARPEILAREAGDATDAPTAEAGRADDELDALRDLEERLVPLLGLLDRVPLRAPWAAHLAAIAELAPHAIRRPELALAILEELAVLASDDDPVDLAEVLAVIEPRLVSMERPPPRRGYGRVLVTRPVSMRGRARRVVILCGVGERIFPERVREDPLLLDRARKRLGGALATRHTRSLEQRAALAIAAGAASERFFASFPRGDAALGRSRVASLYALEIARAISGEVPDLARLEEQTKTVSGARLAWPAPTDAASAIDDLEYELAIAKDLERRAEGQAKGRLRFLLMRHRHLDRSLRFRFWRGREGIFTADGLVAPSPEMRERFAKHSLRSRAYGPSSLEAFAACPYRFFLRSIMRLAAREEPTPVERLEPMTRGNLYHRCQASVARGLAAEGKSAASDPDRARELFREALVEEADLARQRLEPLIAQVFDEDIGALERDLLGYVDEAVRAEDPFAPFAQELTFGAAPTFVVRGGYRLRGAIDAVEIDPDRRLRITDYKTGRLPEDLGPYFSVKGGEVLQPILYALAVEALRGGPEIPADTRTHVTRLYFATERGGYEAREIAVDDTKIERGREALEIVDEALKSAVLLPLPKEKACDRCDYRAVCGDDEPRRATLKVAKKGRVEENVIASLRALRRMP